MVRPNNKLIKEYIHDPYFMKVKYPDPSVCEKCGVSFHDGVFEWSVKPPRDARKMVCPACRRAEDDYEGGHVTLDGDFLAEHREDIINIIRNTEASEKKKRPLERIIATQEVGGKIEIRTTYEHIARRIGEAVQKAYKGELRLQYPQGEKYVRVHWRRDG